MSTHVPTWDEILAGIRRTADERDRRDAEEPLEENPRSAGRRRAYAARTAPPDERPAEDIAQDSLFPDLPVPVAVPREQLSPDRRRTLRQHALVDIGIHPLTKTPVRAGTELCGTCIFRVGNARSYPKCWWRPGATSPTDGHGPLPRVTAGPATDVRSWWPACTDWVWDREHIPTADLPRSPDEDGKT